MKQTGISSQDRRTPLERRLAVRMRHAPIGQCLTFEQFMELAQRGRRAPEYHAHMLHVVSCPACRRAYLNLRALQQLQRPSLARWLKRFRLPSMPQWALASGVAASVFALALWTLYPKSSNPNMVATRPESSSRVEVAQNAPADTNAGSQLSTPSQGNRAGTPNSPSKTTDQNNAPSPPTNGNSSGTKLAQTPSTPRKQGAPPSTPGKPSGAPADGAQRPSNQTAPESPGDRDRTALAQTPPSSPSTSAPSKEPSGSANSAPSTLTLEQRLANASNLFRTSASKLSEALASLTSNSTRRSGNNTPSTGQVKFIEPDLSESRLLEEAQPLFKWEPVNNATKYVVSLRTKSGNLVLVDELSPEQTVYRPSTPLERGNSYTLTLEVVREGLSTLRGTLRFEVMSADDLHDLRVARANVQKHPEASGVVFYRLQRYKEALTAFEVALQRNPKDPEIRRIVERLRELIR